MKVKSLKDLDVSGKKVLLRVDFNVPLENGKIMDDTRMTAALPTIEHLLKSGAKIIVMSHLGRPEEEGKEGLKMDPIAKHLGELLKKPVKKLDACIGPDVQKAVADMKAGDVIMLENTRFYDEEEQCDDNFCKELAALADLYVTDSFGTAHRKHATTYGIAKHLPAYAGLLMEKEITTLSEIMKDTEKPLAIIMGGSKIETKIGLIRNFLPRADYFLIGGGLANTFLAAEGFDVGASLYEKEKIPMAQEIMLAAESLKDRFLLPIDAVVADQIGDNVPSLDLPLEDVEGDMKILDIGKRTVKLYTEVIKKAKTIIWNGPLGLFEKKAFAEGTAQMVRAIANNKGAKTIIGGGDTIDSIKNLGISLDSFTHVSTGGGAMLQFLEGTALPGVEIIMEK
ncbi:MAG TPA: phosphoglycerate kinase [Candidatus Gracilibacteria bacterium]|nr:phosphoglycerate kinase [Candidatus Gracilibacteria bacterium]